MFLMQPEVDDFDNYLAFAKEEGLGFEIADFIFPELLDDEKKSKEILSLYKGTPVVSLHGPFIDLNYSGGDELIFEISKKRIMKCAQYAVELGAKKMVLHSCFFTVSEKDDPLYDIWSKRAAEFFEEVIAESGLTICVENVIDRDPDIIRKMMDTSSNEKVRVCLDIGHANFSNTGIDSWMSSLSPYIAHYHLHDNKGYYDEHIPAGDGTVDFKRFFELVKRYDAEYDMVIEVKTLERVKKSFEYLKQYV